MRRWLIFLFLADLAAMPFLIGMFAGGGGAADPPAGNTRAVSTATLPSLDACDLLNGEAAAQYQGVVDHYSEIEQAAAELGLEVTECGSLTPQPSR